MMPQVARVGYAVTDTGRTIVWRADGDAVAYTDVMSSDVTWVLRRVQTAIDCDAGMLRRIGWDGGDDTYARLRSRLRSSDAGVVDRADTTVDGDAYAWIVTSYASWMAGRSDVVDARPRARVGYAVTDTGRTIVWRADGDAVAHVDVPAADITAVVGDVWMAVSTDVATLRRIGWDGADDTTDRMIARLRSPDAGVVDRTDTTVDGDAYAWIVTSYAQWMADGGAQ